MDEVINEKSYIADDDDLISTSLGLHTIVAFLMDPIMLTHQAINQRPFLHSHERLESQTMQPRSRHPSYRHISSSVLEESGGAKILASQALEDENKARKRLQERPPTPYPTWTAAPASNSVKLDDPTSTSTSVQKKIKTNYVNVKAKENELLYLEILRDNSIDPNLDNLYSKIQVLSQTDLLELLNVAYVKSGTKMGSELLQNLIDVVVNRIVFKSDPNNLYFEIMKIATKRGIPLRLFALTCTHINFLSEGQLNELVLLVVNKNYALDLNSNLAFDFARFNTMILEISWNLNELYDGKFKQTRTLLDLDHVKDVLNFRGNGKRVVRNTETHWIERIKLSFSSTILLTFLRANLHKPVSLHQFKEVILKLQDFTCNTLNLDPVEFIKQLDSVWKIYYKNETSSPKNLANFLVALHEVIVETTELPSMPDAPIGFEDVYFYTKYFMSRLLEARVLYYQLDLTVSDENLIKLLVLADTVSDDKRNDLLMSLSMFKEIVSMAKRIENTSMNQLSLRLQILLKSINTFPEDSIKQSDICSAEKVTLQDKILISWPIPVDLFLDHEPISKEELYKYIHITSILPSLFLYHVFGISHRFTKLKFDRKEIPDAQELVVIVNFFLKRWCSIRGDYTKIQVKIQ